MLSFPNCKINIGLYVTNRRNDGYHDLETIFYPLRLCDVLELVPASKTQLHVSGLTVAGDMTSNLVWKAYQLLKKNFNVQIPELGIYLNKTIPMGAGLGGGSADGAFMLRMLNDYCKLSLDKEQLISFAAQLGSDCPFFIHNSPQIATGRGEIMNNIALDLSSYSIQLICPEVHVATGKAFSMLTPKPAAYDLRKLPELPISGWKTVINNDFEEPIFREYPELADIKQQLYGGGAIYAAMSGSGSAIFGIFFKNERAKIAANISFKEFYFA